VTDTRLKIGPLWPASNPLSHLVVDRWVLFRHATTGHQRPDHIIVDSATGALVHVTPGNDPDVVHEALNRIYKRA